MFIVFPMATYPDHFILLHSKLMSYVLQVLVLPARAGLRPARRSLRVSRGTFMNKVLLDSYKSLTDFHSQIELFNQCSGSTVQGKLTKQLVLFLQCLSGGLNRLTFLTLH